MRSRRPTAGAAPEVVDRNSRAVDSALAGLHRVELPEPGHLDHDERADRARHTRRSSCATVTAAMMAGHGDELPVSALPIDGTYPSGTTKYEKRNISDQVAVWDSELCIQCGNCSFVCPHSVIRTRYYNRSRLLRTAARPGFKSAPLNGPGLPSAALHAAGVRRGLHRLRAVRRGLPGAPARRRSGRTRRSTSTSASRCCEVERENIAFFEQLPEADRARVDFGTVRGTQFLEPLFEFSGACAGLRRDPVPEAALAAVRRPPDGRQRDRLLLDLRRQPADHAVDGRRRRPRPGVVELAVRGQRRVRPGPAARGGPSHRDRPASPVRAARAGRRRARRRDPGRAAADASLRSASSGSG